MSNGKILVVDDDKNICELLGLYLENEGFNVYSVNDGESAVREFQTFQPDLVILDIMLPRMDGWQVCREIRKVSEKPIIMVTAKGETFDKVLGLELGADDYIVKPFDPKEIVARIKAVLRRTHVSAATERKLVEYDKLSINLTNYEMKVDGKIVNTPPKELELIFHLASNPNHVFTRDQLLDEVWGFDYYGDSRTVDVHIKRLREKLEGVSDKWALKTVWGVGYKLTRRNPCAGSTICSSVTWDSPLPALPSVSWCSTSSSCCSSPETGTTTAWRSSSRMPWSSPRRRRP